MEVYASLGSAHANALPVTAVTIEKLVEDFLEAFAAGELPGRAPTRSTVSLYRALLCGKRGGLIGFAHATQRTVSTKVDAILVRRWLEHEARRASRETLRLRLIAARRLVEFAAARRHVPTEVRDDVRELRAPTAARAPRHTRTEGVADINTIRMLLGAMRPRRRVGLPYHRVAELQFRLGLRRSEVIALDARWLDEKRGQVRVPSDDDFETKTHQARVIDGVDTATFALAREVIAIKARNRLTVSAYREAFDRACQRLATAGTPWPFSRKTHALRAAYATASRIAGVPLSIVALRLGHASERTTERHYLGPTAQQQVSPFAQVPRLSTT